MPKVVITAEVEDTAKWEQGFRSHGDLFRSQTITKPIGMAIREGNRWPSAPSRQTSARSWRFSSPR